MVYTENEIELLWLIKPSTIYDEYQTGQRHGRLYKCDQPWNEIELSWSIGLDVLQDKNQRGQWPYWSYMYGLRQKWNWVVVSTGTGVIYDKN